MSILSRFNVLREYRPAKKNEGQLLQSLIKPHKFVTTETVSQLIVVELILLFLRLIQQYRPFRLKSSLQAFLCRKI